MRSLTQYFHVCIVIGASTSISVGSASVRTSIEHAHSHPYHYVYLFARMYKLCHAVMQANTHILMLVLLLVLDVVLVLVLVLDYLDHLPLLVVRTKRKAGCIK